VVNHHSNNQQRLPTCLKQAVTIISKVRK